jgi:hypothetical protein
MWRDVAVLARKLIVYADDSVGPHSPFLLRPSQALLNLSTRRATVFFLSFFLLSFLNWAAHQDLLYGNRRCSKLLHDAFCL